MDTITHGIAGALLGKGFFGFSKDETENRVAIFALTAGAMFPDIDFLAYGFSTDPMAMIRYHRGITHSFLALPLFAVALAFVTRWFARKAGMRSPGLWLLTAIFGIAIASHILLDLCTSYGTQLWYPLSTHRAAWDILFIIDLTFSAILLLPQIVAWICREPAKSRARALGVWLLAMVSVLVIWKVTIAFGIALSGINVLVIAAIVSLILWVPVWTRSGFRISRASWCRAGTYAALAYIAAAAFAHHDAIERVRNFVATKNVPEDAYAAIPMPPSIWRWNGLVQAADGVYVSSFDLRDRQVSQYDFAADSPPNAYTSEALQLPSVKTYLWFSRFPVISTENEAGETVVEFGDARFRVRRQQGAGLMTLRVIFNSNGQLEGERWLRISRLARARDATGEKSDRR